MPRFKDDLQALKYLLDETTPPLRVIRSKHLRSVGITFVDASGAGRGSATIASNQSVSIHMGKNYKKESSNYLELENLIDTLETEYKAGHLTNIKLFLCTDNVVSERAFYKGNSKSRKLFGMVVRLRKFQLCSHCKVHVLQSPCSTHRRYEDDRTRD